MPDVSPQFQAIHDGLCQALGLPAQTLHPDDLGVIGFSLSTRGTQLHAVQSGDGQSVLLMAELGPLPPGAEHDGMEALLDANYLLLDPDAPVFSRNPVNKQVTVQCTRSTTLMRPDELVAMAQQLVAIATNWQSGQLLDALRAKAAQSRPMTASIFA